MISQKCEVVEYDSRPDYTPEVRLAEKIENLNYKLSLCGQWARVDHYCKKCELEGLDTSLLKVGEYKRFRCEIHLCGKPECLVQRFASQSKVFDELDFKGLRNLWHFVVGFELISKDEFQNNMTSIRKRHQAVLNNYFSKLKKKGLNVRGVRVMDFCFKEDGRIYIHYHFGCVPVGQRKIGQYLKIMNDVSVKMISQMKIKTSFVFESFGMKNKAGVLSYLAKRSAGLYSWKESSKVDYIPSKKGKLLKDIKNGKYMTLKDVLSPEQYINHFYNRSHFVTIGGLPRPLRRSCIPMDDVPHFCKIHGELEPKDIRSEMFFKFASIPPPPCEQTDDLVIEYQKF